MNGEGRLTTPATDGSVLYKYRNLDGKSRERVERIIKKSRIYLPSARSFNDPFDMKVRFERRATDQEVRKFFDDILKRRTHLSQSQRKIEVERSTGKANRPEELARLEKDMQDRIYSKLGVLSLSEDPTQILMWSHYAASHAGLCLGFRARDPLFSEALPVNYQNEYVVLDAIRDAERGLQVLTTKASIWCYERERRVVDLDGPRERSFQGESLSTIILGSRMCDTDREDVWGWLEGCRDSVEVLEARESKTKYALDFHEYAPAAAT